MTLFPRNKNFCSLFFRFFPPAMAGGKKRKKRGKYSVPQVLADAYNFTNR
jgi:hypothetical protein